MLQTHDLSDYLRRREIAAEALSAALGFTGCVAILLLTTAGQIAQATTTVGLALGAVVVGTSALALLLQRRLVRSPVRAEGPSQLIAHDVQLAIAVRDLVGVPLTTALSCLFAFLLWTEVAWWIAYAVFFLAIAIAGPGYDPKRRPAMVPVARQLVGKTHST